jgi:hypothetical protein
LEITSWQMHKLLRRERQLTVLKLHIVILKKYMQLFSGFVKFKTTWWLHEMYGDRTGTYLAIVYEILFIMNNYKHDGTEF